jgi:hypothetical protein
MPYYLLNREREATGRHPDGRIAISREYALKVKDTQTAK